MGPASRVMGPTSGRTNQNNPNWSVFIKAREIKNITNSSIAPEDESLINGGGQQVVFMKENTKFGKNKSRQSKKSAHFGGAPESQEYSDDEDDEEDSEEDSSSYYDSEEDSKYPESLMKKSMGTRKSQKSHQN